MELLLERGADATVDDGGFNRFTPLHWISGWRQDRGVDKIARNKQIEVMEMLLDKGADIYETNSHTGETPMSISASRGTTLLNIALRNFLSRHLTHKSLSQQRCHLVHKMADKHLVPEDVQKNIEGSAGLAPAMADYNHRILGAGSGIRWVKKSLKA